MGRNILPKSIALPFSMLAEKLNAKPFMEYALSYALYNYKRIDATKEISFDNLSLIRSFEGSKDEAGFVLVHVDMVSHSAKLIAATEDILCAQDDMSLVAGLSKMTTCFRAINDSMQKMWSRSSPEGYASFRTFIMGIKNQPMFPNGVVYEGVSSDPLFFRGESGANDSMVPLLDNLLEITNKMPDNPLTQILSEFRTYRPILHEKYLKLVKSRSEGLIERCMKSEESAALAITLMDFLREFRWRHWHFTKAYILSYSKHPVATGGSPIIKWLPNQLSVVLSEVSKLCDQYQSSFGPLNSQIMKIKEKSIIDIDTLNKEIKFLEETFK
ncbi:hypothetical protein DI09_87p60 [Mitosporidium daphniae]|uniref:Indoleamine 2,3-dioxygenase n=1 Tax=Mitosporidium daphniae TaxID=1485682 RepID=A0A098VM33_9MICR|nr:uncharacterized protein DI09_87p60 [Mitosporidium daphniae]KGG50133.1 hypothetical protein DI09_87p60 [Mitosporidium daphniae]|eukprot:XP_013236569.1 uncharacterized protein DI09_87p60 [Mitosporidium daphniae]